MAFKRVINQEGDTLADSVLEALERIADALEEILALLKEKAS